MKEQTLQHLSKITFNGDIHNVDPMEGSSFSVRKGTWTEEEDILLKKCVENYGEGKWHKVPSRAGLNRCRKSCRLRWLNYLKPNINRGAFGADEVDLIIRLHNLLGNRWSLIAGRLPGRTANDVKNYWNTHLRKKFNPSKKDSKPKYYLNPSNPIIKVIKPRPQTLSMNSFPVGLDGNNKNNSTNNKINYAAATPSSSSLILPDSCNNRSYCIRSDNDEIMWWENMLMNDKEDDDQQHGSLSDINQFLGDQAIYEDLGERRSSVAEEGSCGSWDELFHDLEFWDVFNP